MHQYPGRRQQRRLIIDAGGSSTRGTNGARARKTGGAAFESNGGPNVRGFFARWEESLKSIGKELDEDASDLGRRRTELGKQRAEFGAGQHRGAKYTGAPKAGE